MMTTADRSHPLEEEIAYCARTYSRGQLQPHADLCAAGKCRSYIHCFFSCPPRPLPICARTILMAMPRIREATDE